LMPACNGVANITWPKPQAKNRPKGLSFTA
jgi:hypothetical protein